MNIYSSFSLFLFLLLIVVISCFYHIQIQFIETSCVVGDVERHLGVNVEVYGKDDPSYLAPYNLLYARNTSQDVICTQGPGLCDPLVLVDNQDLHYSYYSLVIRVTNGGQVY